MDLKKIFSTVWISYLPNFSLCFKNILKPHYVLILMLNVFKNNKRDNKNWTTLSSRPPHKKKQLPCNLLNCRASQVKNYREQCLFIGSILRWEIQTVLINTEGKFLIPPYVMTITIMNIIKTTIFTMTLMIFFMMDVGESDLRVGMDGKNGGVLIALVEHILCRWWWEPMAKLQ